MSRIPDKLGLTAMQNNPECKHFYVEGMAEWIVKGVMGTDPLTKSATRVMLSQGYKRAKEILREEGVI